MVDESQWGASLGLTILWHELPGSAVDLLCPLEPLVLGDDSLSVLDPALPLALPLRVHLLVTLEVTEANEHLGHHLPPEQRSVCLVDSRLCRPSAVLESLGDDDPERFQARPGLLDGERADKPGCEGRVEGNLLGEEGPELCELLPQLDWAGARVEVLPTRGGHDMSVWLSG